ncbi:hypothetical protein PM082_010909 [Marasmius tenuissimus]|nr:hypothetical protein PM082_010909 [Marasmius tenuissimus]
MVKSVPLVSAYLAAITVQSALYGFFVLLSAISIYAMAKADGRLTPVPRYGQNRAGVVSSTSLLRTVKRPLFIGGAAMIGIVTSYWVFSAMRLFMAVLQSPDPTLFYADLSHWTEVTKIGLMMASLILGDSLLIYRLWIVWNRKLAIVIFPLLTVTGLVVAGVGLTYQLSVFRVGQDIFTSEVGLWIKLDSAFTLWYGLSLIAWRIWRQKQDSSPFLADPQSAQSNLLTRSFIVFVESAALYTIWTVLYIATFESKSVAQFFVINCFPTIAGISFMSINARIFLSSETAGNSRGFSSASATIPRYNAPYVSNSEIADTQDTPYTLRTIKPVAVSISHIVERENPSTDKGELSRLGFES